MVRHHLLSRSTFRPLGYLCPSAEADALDEISNDGNPLFDSVGRPAIEGAFGIRAEEGPEGGDMRDIGDWSRGQSPDHGRRAAPYGPGLPSKGAMLPGDGRQKRGAPRAKVLRYPGVEGDLFGDRNPP
jgi:hypothetical protein